jgi:hypothetical protein
MPPRPVQAVKTMMGCVAVRAGGSRRKKGAAGESQQRKKSQLAL